MAAHAAGLLTRAERVAVVRDATRSWPVTDPPIRLAMRDDEPALVALLCGCFATDPLVNWIIGPDAPDGRRRRAFFRMCLQLHDLAAGEVLTTDDHAAVFLWNLSECNATGLPARAVQVPNFLGFAAPMRIPQLLRFFAALEAMRPAEPHVYVQFLGVSAAQRRSGLGAALMRCATDVADHLERPTYGEASRRVNVEIWGRCGMEERESMDLAPGAPTLFKLLRPPRSGRRRARA